MVKALVSKVIQERLEKSCASCERKLKIILYTNHSYRGGYYFGKIPLHSKEAWEKAMEAGTSTEMLGSTEVQVLKKDPEPYKYVEHWECSKCYRGSKIPTS